MAQDSKVIDQGHLMDVFEIPEIRQELIEIPDEHDFGGGAEGDAKINAMRQFMLTYDTSHLRRVGYTPADIELLKSKLWGNQVLIKLLDNYSVPTAARGYSQSTYIEGPISVRVYQLYTRRGTQYKTIYLFGEYHRDTQTHCIQTFDRRFHDNNPTATPAQIQTHAANRPTSIRFEEFLASLSRETPSFFDFFLETGFQEDSTQQLVYYGDYYNRLFYTLAEFSRSFVNMGIALPLDLANINQVFQARGLPVQTSIADFVNHTQPTNLDTNVPYGNNVGDNNLARQIIIATLNTGMPAIGSANYNNIILPAFLQYARMPINLGHIEMISMKRRFHACFKRDERKTTEVSPNPLAQGLPNFERCKLARFHDIDARKLLLEDETITPVQILMSVIMFRDYGMPQFNNYMVNVAYFDLYRNLYLSAGTLEFLENVQRTGVNLVIQPNSTLNIKSSYCQVMYDWFYNNFPPLRREIDRAEVAIRNSVSQFIRHKFLVGNQQNTIDFGDTLNEAIGFLNGSVRDPARGHLVLTELAYHFFYMMALVMDSYFLLRMFKKYRIKSDCQPNKNYTVIAYVGDAHRAIYSEFLENHLNIRPVYSYDAPYRDYSCVDMNMPRIGPAPQVPYNILS